MIPMPKDWVAAPTLRGVRLVHADGPSVAFIEYHERLSPLRRLGALIRELAPEASPWVTRNVETPLRLTTSEGEHAAWVRVHGLHRGAPAQRVLGVVFTDDFCSVTHAVCLRQSLEAEVADLVGEMTQRDTHVLGLRRRRFEYRPPPGWQPLRLTGVAVDWLVPEYPKERTNLTIYGATPHQLVGSTPFETAEAYFEASGFRVIARPRREPVASEAGLSGELAEYHMRHHQLGPVLRRMVILRDERFAYSMELASVHRERFVPVSLEALAQVVRSTQPVPPGRALGPSARVVGHWLD